MARIAWAMLRQRGTDQKPDVINRQSLDVVFLSDAYSVEEPQRSLARYEITAALTSHFQCGILGPLNAEVGRVLPYDSWIRDRAENGDLFWFKVSDQVQ